MAYCHLHYILISYLMMPHYDFFTLTQSQPQNTVIMHVLMMDSVMISVF